MRLASLALCAALSAGLPAAAAQDGVIDGFVCGEERHRRVSNLRSPELMYEVVRTNEALDACTRPRDSGGSEEYLYTWGHRDKLARMLSAERLQYCAHDQARLLTAMARAYDKVQSQQSSRNETLDAALTKVVRDYLVVPSPSWYPDMIGKSATQIEAAFRAARSECGSNTRCSAHYDGRLDGLAQVEAQAQPRLSTATFGAGVSFAADPLSFIGHKYGDDHLGLVCHIGATGLDIADIYGAAPEASLEALRIRIPASATGEVTALRSLLPWYEPVAFEHAAHGRILRVRSNGVVYLDKCAIEYRTSCRYITVDNLDSCAALTQVHALLDRFVHAPDELDDRQQADARILGAYLVDRGPYPNTATVLEALRQRRELRCPSQ